ncbi:MAG: prepilin-type N-terminal cleavage/methylation domain-containing protein [Gammaproteobacteria bacterium]|nr:prepilin-type N-terminal cleavage/methylation domain-containing protein [Gammaproteobacteria bacterium]
MTKSCNAKGFTLIELMIVVVIVAILAAIALPSYRNSVLKSRRTDGESALLQASQRLEVYYANNAGYTTTLATAKIPAISPEGYYTIAITDTSADATTACPITSCYELTVTPTAKSGQNSDKIKGLRLNSRGIRQFTYNNTAWKKGW